MTQGASQADIDIVRSVTRAVVDRLGSTDPAVIEAVVAEVLASVGGGTVTTPRGATLLPIAASPTFEVCATCVEQEKARGLRRAIMTTTGKNSKGIVARITARVAELGGDILDISQTLVADYFTMIIVVDVGALAVPFAEFQEALRAIGRDIGCQVMIMHEDVMASLHRV